MTTPIPSEVIEDAYAAGIEYGLANVFACDGALMTEKLTKFAQLQRLRDHSSKEVAELVAYGIVEIYDDGTEFLTQACVDQEELQKAKEVWLDQSEIKTIPLFTYSPSCHLAAASMKQKCLEICESLKKGVLDLVNVRELQRRIEAIPTVEESK
jgi:hypothetical protein